MSATLQKGAFALIFSLSLFTLFLLSPSHASAQGVAAGTINVNPDFPNYFEVTGSGSFFQGGDISGGPCFWEVDLDGGEVAFGFIANPPIEPGTLISTVIGPLEIGQGGIDGGLLHGQHTCEFLCKDIEDFTGGPPGEETITLWDTKLVYNFPP